MNTSHEKLLIVEDEELVALDLAAILRELGYDVVGHAALADAAVEMAGRLRPALVLMDINLRGPTDGIHAASRIKREFDIPVIFVTAYDDDATLGRAQIVEPFGYILKPYHARELRVCIETALFHHLMQRERNRLTRKLEAVVAENGVLQGLLTTCCACHKIKDQQHGWVSLEQYVEFHSLLRFSHGYCPVCAQAAMDEMRTPKQ